mmetsp:Transcript_5292/g.11474  ORF Transcript_5292/g.11474 Transcript_5292/m.11474 type:complete len:335 (-) Transcript_5292:101-1105(-)
MSQHLSESHILEILLLGRLLYHIRRLDLRVPYVSLRLRGHHGQYPLREVSRVLDLVPARQRRHVVQEHGEVLGLLGLLPPGLDHELQVPHDGMRRVHLQHGLVEAPHHASVRPAAGHVLSLHVPLHRGAHAVRALNQRRRALGQEVRHFHLLDLSGQRRLQIVFHGLVVLVELVFLLLPFLLVFVIQLEPLLTHIHQFEVLVLRHRLNHDLVQRLRQVQHLVAPAPHLLGCRAELGLFLPVSRNVIDLLLSLLHILRVLIQRGVFLPLSLGREESQQGHDVVLVPTVLDDADFEVLAEVVPEHDVLALVLVGRNIANHVQALPHEALVDDAEYL